MGKVQEVRGEVRSKAVGNVEGVSEGGTVASRLEEQSRRNAVEMEKRCARIRAEMSNPNYPMKPDNPLLNATDDEIRAYIRKRREDFKPKWEAYLIKQATLSALASLGKT